MKNLASTHSAVFFHESFLVRVDDAVIVAAPSLQTILSTLPSLIMSSQSWLSPGVADEEAQKEQDSNWASTDNEDFTPGVSSNAASSSGETKRGCTFWLYLFLGTVLSILFIIAASLQWTDANLNLMWGIFYVAHAVLAIVGTLRMCMCKAMLSKPILFVSGAMLLWSIALLIVAAVDLSKTPSGGAKEGGDASNRTERQEIGYELGGSILGCLSCIYFFCMVLCCDTAPSN